MDKKSLTLLLLTILYKYSSKTNCLTQQKIIDYLQQDYAIDNVNRKTIASHLTELELLGYEIEQTKQGVYLANRILSDEQLSLLAGFVFSARFIDDDNTEKFINIFKTLGTLEFSKTIKQLINLKNQSKTSNGNLLNKIKLINTAINNNCKISFDYYTYDIKGKLGKSRSYNKFNPYFLAIKNNSYYLVGNYDKYENLSYLHLSLIDNITLLKESIRKISNTTSINIITNSYAYMFGEKTERITFIIQENLIREVIDVFGNDVTITPIEESLANDEFVVRVSVRAVAESIKYWIMQYGKYIKLEEPKWLVEEIKNDMQITLKYYK